MIRINLYGKKSAKSSSSPKSSAKKQSANAMTGDDGLLFEEDTVKRDALVHLAIILLPFLLLFIYEKQNIPGLQSEYRSIQNNLINLQSENQKFEAITQELKQFNEEKEVLEGQIAAIKKLSDGRMNIVKSIETVQHSLPSKIWLNSFEVTGREIKIQGTALTDLDISGFMEKISGSSHMSKVELLEADQATLDVIGNVKNFSISANLEEQ